MQLLFYRFFVVVTVVIGFIVDVPDPGVMQMPPRRPGTRIVNRPQTVRWVTSGFTVAAIALSLLAWGPDEPSTSAPTASMTMAFAVVALTAVNLGLVLRREREPAWSSPVFPYLGWILLGWTLAWAALELGMLQRLLDTRPLTGSQWVAVILLSLVTPAGVGIDKAIQLSRRCAEGQAARLHLRASRNPPSKLPDTRRFLATRPGREPRELAGHGHNPARAGRFATYF